MSISNVHFIVGDAQFCTYYSRKKEDKKRGKRTIDFVSRFLEETSKAAAHQQEELLGEEDPGDLVE